MRVINSFNEVFPFRNSHRITCGTVGTVMNVELSAQTDLPEMTGVERQQNLMSLCGDAMNLLGILGVATESLVLDYQDRVGRTSGGDDEKTTILKDDFFAEDYDGEYDYDEEPAREEDYQDLDDEELEDGVDDTSSVDDPNDLIDLLGGEREEVAEDEEEDEEPEPANLTEMVTTRKEQEMSDFLQSFREGMVSESGKRIYPELVSRVRQIRKEIIDGYRNVWKLYNSGALGYTKSTVEKRVVKYIYPLNQAQMVLLGTEAAQPFFMGKNAYSKVDPSEYIPSKVTVQTTGKNGKRKTETIELVKPGALKALEERAKVALTKSGLNDNVYLGFRK